MFKCGACNENTEPREKANRVVIEMRDSPKHNGKEIAKEALLCTMCHEGVLAAVRKATG